MKIGIGNDHAALEMKNDISVNAEFVGIFPRENNSLNKFMSNFSLAAIVMLLALVSFNIDNESIKITIYIFGILLISIINLRIIIFLWELMSI